jgi:hypothetical protein
VTFTTPAAVSARRARPRRIRARPGRLAPSPLEARRRALRQNLGVFSELADVLSSYSKSSGALRFDIDTPLPRDVVEKLIAVRIRQAFPA